VEAVHRAGELTARVSPPVVDVVIEQGLASAFHARDLPEVARTTVWWFEVTRPALVLGSSQPMAHVDSDACARAGVEVVRRRSGGAAVLVRPGEMHWVDVIVPAGHPRWSDDVGRAGRWIGEAWQRAAAAVGVAGAMVYDGPMRHDSWSRHVCFAGLAAGEVLLGEAKLVGVSQRRSRHGARFQCAWHRRWDPDALVGLLAEPRPSAGEIRGVVAAAEVDAAALRTALVAELRAATLEPAR
jgi:lipoate-protein ligase A